MSEIAASGAMADLAPLLASLPAADDALLLVERLPVGWITDAALREVLRLEPLQSGVTLPWPSRGRVFGADFELRWESVAAGGVQTRYIGTPRELPGLTQLHDIDLSLVDDSTALDLWGKAVSPGNRSTSSTASGLYSELRLPRLLLYPFAPPLPRRVQVRTRRYLQPGTGVVQLSRWLGLQAASACARDGDQ